MLVVCKEVFEVRGHIRKRGNSWSVVVYLGYDEQGKKRYKWHGGFKTKRDAERFLATLVEQVHDGTYVEPSKKTVGAYLREWLDDKRTKVRPGTLRSYVWLVEHHIIPRIGQLELAKLRPSHIQKLYTDLQTGDEHISKRSVLHAHRILHQALDRAVKWGLITRNVTDAVEPPRPARQEMRVWTDEQLDAFLQAARKSRYYVAFVLLSSTGMRVGEVLALRWEDVDLQAGLVRVVRSYSYTGKGYRIEEPKTESGRRSIALPPAVVDLLRKHKTEQAARRLMVGSAWEDNDLVICTAFGKPILQHNLRTSFHRIIERTGLPRIRLHDLRHTHATILLQRGVHPKVVQERLGHSDITLTLNTYSHVVPGLQEAAARSIDDLFSPSSKRISTHED